MTTIKKPSQIKLCELSGVKKCSSEDALHNRATDICFVFCNY
jgi:hypothetical protein